MSIYDMIPGNKYLCGDSLGYDVIECIAVNIQVEGYDELCVKVKYIENGREDIWFESPDYSGSIYVEPR